MKIETAPHSVLTKLFALQNHAEQVADLKTRMPEIVSKLRRVINDESQIGETRDEVSRNRKAAEAEFQALCAFGSDPIHSITLRADAASRVYSNCKFWLDNLPDGTSLELVPQA